MRDSALTVARKVCFSLMPHPVAGYPHDPGGDAAIAGAGSASSSNKLHHALRVVRTRALSTGLAPDELVQLLGIIINCPHSMFVCHHISSSHKFSTFCGGGLLHRPSRPRVISSLQGGLVHFGFGKRVVVLLLWVTPVY